MTAGLPDPEPTHLPEQGDVGGGGRRALQGAVISGLVWASQERVCPVSGENQRVGCLSWGPHSGGPVFSVLSCCLSSCLSPTSVCPLNLCSSSNTQFLVCFSPQPPGTPKGPPLRLCLAVPVPMSPMAQGPCPAPSSLQRLSPSSGHSFTTFLLSCPSPRAPACSGREVSRTLLPLFKVSRCVSQEGGLPHPSTPTAPQPGAPPQPRGPEVGEGAIPGGPDLRQGGRDSRDLTLGRAPGLVENVSVCMCAHVS